MLIEGIVESRRKTFANEIYRTSKCASEDAIKLFLDASTILGHKNYETRSQP